MVKEEERDEKADTLLRINIIAQIRMNSNQY